MAAFAVAAGSSVLFAGSVAAADVPDSERIAGNNRYATAVEVAQVQADYADDCYAIDGDDVTVVNGENWPDGLAAAVYGEQILLTRADSLPAETAAELERLVECGDGDEIDIRVIGGTAAVSDAVYAEMATIIDGDADMERHSGDSRYTTAIAVAEDWVEDYEWWWPGCVIMVTGENYPDALAAG
ncbi:MAG: cell wall-binding repeat-containing protein, partial [Ilumatobacteraceae bacterium]